MKTDTPETNHATQWYEGIGWAVPASLAAKLEQERDAVTEQRDRLAKALRKIKNAGGTYTDPYDELDFIDGLFSALKFKPQDPDKMKLNGISKIDDTAGDFVILCDYGMEGIAVVQQCPTAESAAKWMMLNNGGSPLAVVKLVDFSITSENAGDDSARSD
jgi:hypothetical protein